MVQSQYHEPVPFCAWAPVPLHMVDRRADDCCFCGFESHPGLTHPLCGCHLVRPYWWAPAQMSTGGFCSWPWPAVDCSTGPAVLWYRVPCALEDRPKNRYFGLQAGGGEGGRPMCVVRGLVTRWSAGLEAKKKGVVMSSHSNRAHPMNKFTNL